MTFLCGLSIREFGDIVLESKDMSYEIAFFKRVELLRGIFCSDIAESIAFGLFRKRFKER